MSGRAAERPRFETDEAAVSHCYRFLLPHASTWVSPNKPISQFAALPLTSFTSNSNSRYVCIELSEMRMKINAIFASTTQFPDTSTFGSLSLHRCFAQQKRSGPTQVLLVPPTRHTYEIRAQRAACHEPFEIANSSIYS